MIYAKDGAQGNDKEWGSENLQTTKYRPYMIIPEVSIPVLSNGNKEQIPNDTLQIHV